MTFRRRQNVGTVPASFALTERTDYCCMWREIAEYRISC
jgi:hypothetical protein